MALLLTKRIRVGRGSWRSNVRINGALNSFRDACKDRDFFCEIDDDNEIRLKRLHKYYAQVQGQMAICRAIKCDFVIQCILFKGL